MTCFGQSTQFVIFKPLSHCFEKTTELDVKASFASRPLSRIIRWYNKPGDIAKEFWWKTIQFHGNFHGFKIINWTTNYQPSNFLAKLSGNQFLISNIFKLHEYQPFGLMKMHNMTKIWFASNKFSLCKSLDYD